MPQLKCALCGADDTETLWTEETYSLVRCRRCGLAYRDAWELSTETYDEPEYFEGYLHERDKFTRIFEDILDEIARYRRPPGRLLDVGCSVGLLLDLARQRGWRTVGVEVSPWAADYARRELGLTVHTGELRAMGLPAESFDVVVLNHVLEHLPEPVAELREAHRLLVSDGLLVVGTPNFGSPMARLEREHWPALRPEEHLWQFTPATLKGMLRRTGFLPLRLTTAMQERNYRLDVKDTVKRALYFVASGLNMGETMLVVGVRT